MDKGKITELVTQVRLFMEPRWDARRAERHETRDLSVPASTSTCRFSALMVATVLSKATGIRWRIVGGSPVAEADFHDIRTGGNGGIKDPYGTWHGHYWCVGNNMLVDVTADQFGWDPVVTGDAGDPRYRANYLASAVRGHLEHVSQRVSTWHREWREQTETLAQRPGP